MGGTLEWRRKGGGEMGPKHKIALTASNPSSGSARIFQLMTRQSKTRENSDEIGGKLLSGTIVRSGRHGVD